MQNFCWWFHCLKWSPHTVLHSDRSYSAAGHELSINESPIYIKWTVFTHRHTCTKVRYRSISERYDRRLRGPQAYVPPAAMTQRAIAWCSWPVSRTERAQIRRLKGMLVQAGSSSTRPLCGATPDNSSCRKALSSVCGVPCSWRSSVTEPRCSRKCSLAKTRSRFVYALRQDASVVGSKNSSVPEQWQRKDFRRKHENQKRHHQARWLRRRYYLTSFSLFLGKNSKVRSDCFIPNVKWSQFCRKAYQLILQQGRTLRLMTKSSLSSAAQSSEMFYICTVWPRHHQPQVALSPVANVASITEEKNCFSLN